MRDSANVGLFSSYKTGAKHTQRAVYLLTLFFNIWVKNVDFLASTYEATQDEWQRYSQLLARANQF